MSLTASITYSPGVTPTVLARIVVVQLTVGGLNSQLSTSGHRVVRIDNQIGDHLLDLPRVCFDLPQAGRRYSNKFDLVANQSAQQFVHIDDHVVEVEHASSTTCLRAKARSWRASPHRPPGRADRDFQIALCRMIRAERSCAQLSKADRGATAGY